MNHNWCVFHLSSQTQINHLTKDQLQKYLEDFLPEDLNALFLWNENLDDWKPLRDFPEFAICLLTGMTKVNRGTTAVKQPPPATLLRVKEPEDLPKPASSLISRRYPRFQFKLKVLIRNRDIVFRTFTTSVSEGGFGLEHELPKELLNSECQGLLSGLGDSENFRFQLKPVNIKGAQVLTNGQQLTYWIGEYVKSSKGQNKLGLGIPVELKHRLAVP